MWRVTQANVPAAQGFWISTSMDMDTEYGIWNMDMDIGHEVGVAVVVE
jgi:hypothetical protein